jgi:hypothetical protein
VVDDKVEGGIGDGRVTGSLEEEGSLAKKLQNYRE